VVQKWSTLGFLGAMISDFYAFIDFWSAPFVHFNRHTVNFYVMFVTLLMAQTWLELLSCSVHLGQVHRYSNLHARAIQLCL